MVSVAQYLLVAYLVVIGFFTPLLLLVFLAAPKLLPSLRALRAQQPATRPADYRERVWPGWFVAYAFLHNRRWGSLFLLGLLAEAIFATSRGERAPRRVPGPLDGGVRLAGVLARSTGS